MELACLDGAPPPPGLEEDLRSLADLPEAALAGLWTVVAATLPDPVPPGAQRVIDQYARTHDLEPGAVARPVSAVRALFRFATAADLDAEALAADIRLLAGDRADAALAVARGWYEPARGRIHSELLSKTVAAHGKVLSDVDWRIETITSSSFGRGFRLPIVTLTLRYLEDGKASVITLHALPTVLKKLKDTLARLVT